MRRSVRFSLLAAALLAAAACTTNGETPAARRHVVEIRAFQFDPDTLRVAPGDTIVWINQDAVPHTATAEDGAWDSGAIAAGDSWSRVVEGTGTQSYFCTFHPTMRGVIVGE